MIKVLIVDDQIILRESLKFIIEQDTDINVVGLAGNGAEAFSLCGKLKPDVVLMDIMMPDCDGVEGTRLIKSKYESIKVIILTTVAINASFNICSEKLSGILLYLKSNLNK